MICSKKVVFKPFIIVKFKPDLTLRLEHIFEAIVQYNMVTCQTILIKPCVTYHIDFNKRHTPEAIIFFKKAGHMRVELTIRVYFGDKSLLFCFFE